MKSLLRWLSHCTGIFKHLLDGCCDLGTKQVVYSLIRKGVFGFTNKRTRILVYSLTHVSDQDLISSFILIALSDRIHQLVILCGHNL